MKKSALFIPSNENHVRIFNAISKHFKDLGFVFLSQNPYKDEGTEKIFNQLNLNFRNIGDYQKKDPDFIFKKENIGVVVIGNDTDVIPQWFVNSARNANIPSILIQDGVLSEINQSQISYFDKFISLKNSKLLLLSKRLSKQKLFQKITYGLGNCSQIHVWGTTSKQFLEDKKVESHIVLTGDIKLDSVDRTIVKTKNVILYAPTDLVHSKIISESSMKKIIHILCNVVEHIPEISMHVKPHPRENKKFYKILNKYDRIHLSDDDTYSLIKNSSIVISDLSSVILESLYFSKPVISFLPKLEKTIKKDHFPQDLISNGIILYSNDEHTLRENIKNLLESKNEISEKSSNIMTRYYVKLDSQASIRSANNIEDLVRNS